MRSTSLFNKIFSDVWYTHLDIQRDGSHKLLPRYSPSVEIAEVTFSICSGDWAKEDFEVPKSHAMYNPNLLTLEREEYHRNKLYMTENYIVYLASLIYWLQAFFSFSFHTDFNECNLNNAGCEHICANNEGSFNCECRKGFKLKDDKYGCEGA